MNVLGFNFTKISGEKKQGIKFSAINSKVTFTDIKEDDIALLKDSKVLKVYFTFTVDYDSAAEVKKKESEIEKESHILFNGVILLSTDKEEADDILSAWKDKGLPATFRDSLFSLILQKCSVKALSLEEDLSLPYHLPLLKEQKSKK